MSSWLLLVVGAHFLYAITVLLDKHIVVRAAHIGRPIVYAFFISLLSGFVVVIAPFGLVSFPSSIVFGLSLLSAATFVLALFFLYSALKSARASDVAPVVGAISAITTLVLAALFLSGDINASVLPAVLLLVLGTALISHFHFARHALVFAFLSGIFFGTSIFLAKIVYLEAGFLDGFFWTRSLNVVVALSLLLVPTFRTAIFHGGTRSSHGAKALVVGNKVVGGIASVLTAYAINLGSVTVVNALSGLQFVFLFLFALLFSKHAPNLRDSGIFRGHGGWHTALGVALIVSGLALLYATDGLI